MTEMDKNICALHK